MVQSRTRTIPRKESAELEGSLGEVAFAEIFDLPYPDINFDLRSDGGFDFVLPNGSLLDVKSISGPDYWRLGLIVPKRIRSGIYALMHVAFEPDQPCTFLGWQTGGFAVSRGQDKITHYRVAQKFLRTYDDLMNIAFRNKEET